MLPSSVPKYSCLVTASAHALWRCPLRQCLLLLLLCSCSHSPSPAVPEAKLPPVRDLLPQPGLELVAHKLLSGKALQADYRQAVKLIPSFHLQLAARRDTLSTTDAARLQTILHPIINWIQSQATKGDASARLILGYSYWKGLGVLPDNQQAQQWLEKSGAQGNAMATWQLALLQLESKQHDAVTTVASAAKSGIPEARLLYGEINRDGISTPQNYSLARQWFNKAAQDRLPLAQLNMGLMTLYGMGGAQNFEQARQFLLQASPSRREADYWLARLGIEGYGPEVSAATIHQWLLNSLESQASRESTTLLGYTDAVRHDYGAACSLFQRNTPRDPLAAHNLGTLCFTGLGTPPDYQTSLLYLQTGAEYGLVASMKLLGYLCLNGLGTPERPEQAWHWFFKAATLGDAWSAWAAGLLLEAGHGVSPDPVAAYAWQSVALAWGWTTGAGRRDALAASMDRQALMQGQKLAQKFFNDYNYQRGVPVPYLVYPIPDAASNSDAMTDKQN